MKKSLNFIAYLTVLLIGAMSLVLSSCRKDDNLNPEVVENPLDEVVYYITGKVMADDKPLGDVKVGTSEGEVVTGDDGSFQLPVKSKKDYALSFEKGGYVPVVSEVTIPQEAKKQSCISVLQELCARNPLVTVSPDTEITIVEVRKEWAELYFPEGAVKTKVEIGVTDFTEGAKKEKEGLASGSITTIFCEPDGTIFEKPVNFRTKNAITSDLYFSDVKHCVEKGGSWIEESHADFDGSLYYPTTIKGFSNHSFRIPCMVTKGASDSTPLKQVVVDNLGNMTSKEQTIEFTYHLGWKIDGSGSDLVKKQFASLSDRDVAVLSERINYLIASLMGGKPRVEELTVKRDSKISGDAKMTVSASEKQQVLKYGISMVYKGAKVQMVIPVVKSEGLDITVVTELGASHGGSHSGGVGE